MNDPQVEMAAERFIRHISVKDGEIFDATLLSENFK
jgi:hypothetical protein